MLVHSCDIRGLPPSRSSSEVIPGMELVVAGEAKVLLEIVSEVVTDSSSALVYFFQILTTRLEVKD